MIKEAGLYDHISQAFAGLDTNRSVGVFGDQRVWGYIIILRAVRTKDFMSAEIFKFDLEFLEVSFDVLVIKLGLSTNGIPSDPSQPPVPLLPVLTMFTQNVSRRICNEVEGVSRVTYDL